VAQNLSQIANPMPAQKSTPKIALSAPEIIPRQTQNPRRQCAQTAPDQAAIERPYRGYRGAQRTGNSLNSPQKKVMRMCNNVWGLCDPRRRLNTLRRNQHSGMNWHNGYDASGIYIVAAQKICCGSGSLDS
jgi:hypothetical protein